MAVNGEGASNLEQLVTMNPSGGDKRGVSQHSEDSFPTWSPDGRTIAFVSNQDGPWAVWAMSPDGSNRRKLFDVGGGGLRFNWQQEQISWGP